MTFAARRTRYGEKTNCEPSRFLSELPEDDLDWSGGATQLEPEERQERGRAHLAGLRNLLSESSG
jgi:ATP-dependent DNA helicase Rep